MGSPYGPATGLINFGRSIPSKIGGMADEVGHPMQSVMGLLGFHPQPVQAPPQQADPQMVQEANASFQHPKPDVTTMKKPLSKGK